MMSCTPSPPPFNPIFSRHALSGRTFDRSKPAFGGGYGNSPFSPFSAKHYPPPPLPALTHPGNTPGAMLKDGCSTPEACASAKIVEDPKETRLSKRMLVALSPALYSINGVGLLAEALGDALPGKMKQGFSAFVKSPLMKFNMVGLPIAWLFSAVNEVLSGESSKQPSMLLSGLLEFIPVGLLAALAIPTRKMPPEQAEKAFGKISEYGFNLWTLLAATWSVGFANEITNKHELGSKREYDMSPLKDVFNFKKSIPLPARLATLGKELAHIAAFSASDHILMVKSLIQDLKPHHAQSKHKPPNWKALWNSIWQPNPTITRLSVLFTYAGAIPFLLFGLRENNSKTFIRLTQLSKGIGLALADLSIFNLALRRKDTLGRLPVLGAPLVVFGTPIASNTLSRGMSQFGEGLLSWFCSDISLYGLPHKHSQKYKK